MASTVILQHATEAIQAQERLIWLLEQETHTSSEVKHRAHECINSLRTQKATLEGSNADFRKPQVNEESMVELKQLTLMHVPASVTSEVQEKCKHLVEHHLKDQCKSVISITLLTCPWYEQSQKERGEQAKHNILLVIFLSYDDQFFSATNPQIKEKASVIDYGWFCAIEMSHFGQALAKGRTRYLEAVYCRHGAQLYASQEWTWLKQSLDYLVVTSTHSFAEACLGQAVGGIGKKRKTGGMRLKEGATIFEICGSFRLLQHADNTFQLKSSYPEIDESRLPPLAIDAVSKIRSFYSHTEPFKCKHELFDLLMQWSTELRSLLASVKPTLSKAHQQEANTVIGNWMMQTRLQGRQLTPGSAVSDSHNKLLELLNKVGGPVSQMKAEQILLVAVAGSAMYNLNTPTSDVDYLVIFSTPSETLMSSTKQLVETYESRGVEKCVEYGAYEAHTFCEMILKCSVVILELLFSDNHEYMSPMWQELAKDRKAFVTEKAISQYLGLIRNNFKFIDTRKHTHAPKKDRKLFYQNFHKIHSVQHMMKGEVPSVRVTGAVREFIMSVRTQNEGRWSRDNLLGELTKQYRELRESLGQRTQRLKETPDYELLTKWLLSVRRL